MPGRGRRWPPWPIYPHGRPPGALLTLADDDYSAALVKPCFRF
ncbi:MAG: hypothetical protein U0401_00900 [Anaerolineae bacterium]